MHSVTIAFDVSSSVFIQDHSAVLNGLVKDSHPIPSHCLPLPVDCSNKK